MTTPSRRCLLGSIIALTISVTSQIAAAQPALSFAPDRVLVSFKPGAAAGDRRNAHAQAGGHALKLLDAIGVEVAAVASGGVAAAIEKYRRNPNVEFAEPNYRRLLYRPVTIEGAEPGLGIGNNFDQQWGLHNTGQSFGVIVDPVLGNLINPAFTGTADADIDAEEGWTISTGSPSVNVAIIDSGVSCQHVDLDSKCVEQMNFVSEHGSTLEDVLGHGTHVAGIAAAETNNGIGIAGAGWESSFGSLKACWEDTSLALLGIVIGVCDDDDIAEAISHAVNGVIQYDVINLSLAGPDFSSTLEAAVDLAWDAGIVIVAGAGNDYMPDKRYPAAYANVIAVGATDQHDNLASFSSFSTDADDWVSVLAPGNVVTSAVPGGFCGVADDHPDGCYDWKSGTSMATPIVAGVAALLRAHFPAASNVEIRAIIEGSSDQVGALGQNLLAWSQHGRINMHAALSNSQPPPPPASGMHIGDLDATSSSQGGTWTAQVDILAEDDNHDAPTALLQGVVVDYTWSDGQVSGSITCTSNPCSITRSGIRKRVGSLTLTVVQIQAATYVPVDNHDSDGDSDGTSITVAKP